MSDKTPVIILSSVIILSTLLPAALSYSRSLSDEGPIAVVAVYSPVQPYTPAGPTVVVVLKDVSALPVTNLVATLYVFGGADGYGFTFGIGPLNPLMPGKTTQDSRILIGGGFDGGKNYPLEINATLQNGTEFSHVFQVQIVAQA